MYLVSLLIIKLKCSVKHLHMIIYVANKCLAVKKNLKEAYRSLWDEQKCLLYTMPGREIQE